jgi:hypothetical protein
VISLSSSLSSWITEGWPATDVAPDLREEPSAIAQRSGDPGWPILLTRDGEYLREVRLAEISSGLADVHHAHPVGDVLATILASARGTTVGHQFLPVRDDEGEIGTVGDGQRHPTQGDQPIVTLEHQEAAGATTQSVSDVRADRAASSQRGHGRRPEFSPLGHVELLEGAPVVFR